MGGNHEMLRTVLTTWLVLSIGILFSEGAFAEPQRAPEAGAVENLEVERGSTVVRLDRETALMLSPGGVLARLDSEYHAVMGCM
jgi:hypothetical protein